MVTKLIRRAIRKFRRLNPFIIIGAIAVLTALGVFAYSHYSRSASVIIPAKPVTTVTSSTSENPQSTSAAQGSPATSSTTTKTDKSASGVPAKAPSGAGPATPSGTFVSNHFPGKNDTPSSEESLCTTTPGATCYIQFMKGSDVKKLDSKTVDSSGSVVWDWDVKDAGMSQGKWKITAVATLNGKTASADDSLSLEVTP